MRNILFNIRSQRIQRLIDGGDSAVCKGKFFRTHGAEPERVSSETDKQNRNNPINQKNQNEPGIEMRFKIMD